jgi:hypothetical protein
MDIAISILRLNIVFAIEINLMAYGYMKSLVRMPLLYPRNYAKSNVKNKIVVISQIFIIIRMNLMVG